MCRLDHRVVDEKKSDKPALMASGTPNAQSKSAVSQVLGSLTNVDNGVPIIDGGGGGAATATGGGA